MNAVDENIEIGEDNSPRIISKSNKSRD